MPHFPLPSNEDERLVALKSYNIFDTGEEQDYDALTSLASAICQIPIALITFIDENRQWFKSHHGTEHTENSRELSFCAHAIASTDDITIVEDAREDKRFVDNPMVTGPTKVTFYAGVPLVNDEGYALGTLCVIDQEVRSLSESQKTALKTLARQVVDKIELRRKVLTLEKSNQQLMNSNVLIQKFASMAAHDIKNPLSSILLTSQALKRRYEKSPDDKNVLLVDMNIEASKNLLQLVEEMLAYSKDPSLLLQKKQEFRVRNMLNKVLGMLTVPENVIITLPEDSQTMELSTIAFEQIFMNLLSNAIRYNDKDQGIIHIRFRSEQDHYHFEVEDNGIGIEPQHHEKIFESNFTLNTKDRNNKKGSGIGLSTVRDLILTLNGTISLRSTPGEGATFFLSFRKE